MKSGSQVTAALYLGLTFLAGGALGISGTYYYMRTPVTAASTRQMTSENLRNVYLSEMRDRLQLSSEQEKNLTEILDQTRELFRQVQDKRRPEFRAIQERQSDMIRAILNPKQQAAYEVLRTERQERARKMESRQ